jgi:hypothetical protein
LSEAGELRIPPDDWHFLPAGDAAITNHHEVPFFNKENRDRVKISR